MTEKDIKIVELRVNGRQAAEQLWELKKRVKELEEEKAKAEKTLSDGGLSKADEKKVAENLRSVTRELNAKNKELRLSVTRMETMETVLRRLDKATPKQLRATIKELNAELNSGRVERGSEEWNAYTEAIKTARGELKKLNDEQRAFGDEKGGGKGGMFDGLKEFGKDWVGAVSVVKDSFSAVVGAVSGAMNAMRGYVEEYAELQEHMSGVVKYTGLSAESVNELNERFKELDTRTPRAALNDLAADAGRLGIQSKEEVLEFVDAANQITVALGEDLGDDAVKNIGKITQLFATDPGASLRDGMLATASTINDLAQSSSASEPYLLEFTARLSGMANSAKISQTDILGFASVLDQSMVGVEKGSTALQNVLSALFKKPAELAKVAGLNVKEFTDLLQTDANAALLQFLGALKNSGGMDKVAPMLEEMKLSGSGVTQTLTALANNLDKVKSSQEQAAAAYAKGTSVTAEYNTANNTLQAQLEKAQNRFSDFRTELGEKLSPIYVALLNGTVGLGRAVLGVGRAVQVAGGFVVRYAAELGILATMVGVMIARKQLLVAWEQRHVVWEQVLVLWKKRQVAVDLLSAGAARLAAIARSAWSAATVVATTVQGLFTGAVSLSTLAMTALNAVMSVSPIGWLMAGLSALLVVVRLFRSETEKQTDAERKLNEEQERKGRLQKELASAQEEANRRTAEEVARIDQLRRKVQDQTLSYQERNAALEELKRLVPSYHASLKKSGELVNNNVEALDKYIEKLKDKAYAEALQEKLVEAYKKQQDAELVLRRKQRNVNAVKDEMKKHPERYEDGYVMVTDQTTGMDYPVKTTSGKRMSKLAELDTQEAALKSAQQRLDAANRDIDDLSKLAAEARKKVERASGGGGRGGNGGGGNGGGGNGGRGGARGGGGGNGGGDKLLEKERKEGAALERALDAERKGRVEELRAEYASGQKSYAEYYAGMVELDMGYLVKKRDFYKRDVSAREKWQKEIERYGEKEKEMRVKWSLEEIAKNEREALSVLEVQHAQGVMSERGYADAKNEILLKSLQAKRDYLKKWGSVDESEKASAAYDEEMERQRVEREKWYWEKVGALRREYAKKSPSEQLEVELALLKELHDKKYLQEEEYQRLEKALREKYAADEVAAAKRKDDELEAAGRRRLEDARKSVGDSGKDDGGGSGGGDFGVGALGAAVMRMRLDEKAYAHLRELRDKDLEHAAEYDRAMRLLDEGRMENFKNVAGAAFGAVGAMLSSLSSYNQAAGQAEEAQVTARYDAEIKAAEGNAELQKSIEERKQKSLAKVKSEYAERATAMQIAQAVAQTAMAAINAYASAAAVPVLGVTLAPIAAGAALAAGAVQIAAIRKQAEVQREGYYDGGFTGGTNFRREAGVVHEGEFVANHRAVQNPSVLRVLRVIDYAQRTNTVASLNLDAGVGVGAVGAAAGGGGGAGGKDGVTAAALTSTLERLTDMLERGIRSTVTIDGDDGVAYQLERYNVLRGSKN